MSDLFAARSQMAMSLAFHILFAVAGIAMPLLMVLAEGMWRRTGEPVWLELAKRWSKGVAILFGVGAVSGTVLSFELGLLWPGFMEFAGPIIGMPFSLEGFAFFLEAIFLGVYLYGWEKVSPRVHLASGVGVLVCGMLSGIFVVCANAWMNTPAGYGFEDGELWVDVWTAMWNPSAVASGLHMTVASFEAVGFAVAGMHAFGLLRAPDSLFHRSALRIALPVACVAAVLQLFTGHHSAQQIAENQPLKLAAAEAQWETQTRAPLTLGGWPDEQAEETTLGLEIPGALSLLAFNDLDAEVQGLEEWEPEDRPPIAVVHVAYQIMIGAGMTLLGVAGVALVLGLRKRGWPAWFLKLLVVVSPLGMVAIEAGWTVTEVGRQPWVIVGVMRTADAVTPMPHLVVPFTLFSLLYAVLGVVVVVLLRRHLYLTVPEAP